MEAARKGIVTPQLERVAKKENRSVRWLLVRAVRAPEDDHSDTCSMCGKFCAVRSLNKAPAGEPVDIL